MLLKSKDLYKTHAHWPSVITRKGEKGTKGGNKREKLIRIMPIVYTFTLSQQIGIKGVYVTL